MIGFIVCVYSFGCAIVLILFDGYAAKLYPEGRKELKSEGGFKFKDIYNFKLPFWLLTGNCVATYMSISTYFQIVPDILQTKYHFNPVDAGFYASIPFTISAISGTLFGLLVDITGKRGHYIALSAVILIIAFTNSAFSKECYQCNNEVISLVLCGLAYSIYGAAMWGSLPYVTTPSTIGTAFGVCLSLQNIGLFIAPTAIGFIQEGTIDNNHGYFWPQICFVMVNVIGLILAVWLTIIDLKYHDGILYKVDKVDQLTSLVNSPKGSKKDILE